MILTPRMFLTLCSVPCSPGCLCLGSYLKIALHHSSRYCMVTLHLEIIIWPSFRGRRTAEPNTNPNP